MGEFIEVPCKSDFKATIVKKNRVLFPAVQSKVDEIWDREFQLRQGKLFNGSVLGLVNATADEILVEKAEYKLVLATMRDPVLAKAIDFKPLSTSGMTISGGKVLLGQRSQYVSAYPNDYELVPSGSIDSEEEGLVVDLKKQLFKELKEEAEIASSYVEKSEGWALIYDAEAKIYEVVARITVAPFFSSSPIHNAAGEYRSLMWLSQEECDAHLIQHSARYLPLSKYLYAKWRSFLA